MITQKRIMQIKDSYKDLFYALEDYDRTLVLPSQRKRLDITLSVKTISRLKELSQDAGKPISHIIEDMIMSKKKRRRLTSNQYI